MKASCSICLNKFELDHKPEKNEFVMCPSCNAVAEAD